MKQRKGFAGARTPRRGLGWVLGVTGLGLTVGLAPGCGGEDPPVVAAGSEVIYLAPGAGPSNTEPLWPVRAGWRLDGRVPYAVLDARQVGERVVLPLTTTIRGTFEMVGAPSEPGDYRYLAVDEGGVWLVGQPREGLLGQGALLVPSAVRVGMRWETRVGGVKRLAVEVVSREEADTIFGPRAVWTLRIEDHRRFWFDTSETFDLANAPRKLGAESMLRLAEGRGPIDDLPLGAPAIAGALPVPSQVVVPLAPDPVAPVAAPEVTLRRLGPGKEGAVLTENFMVTSAGAYPDPEDPEGIIVAMRGFAPFFGQAFAGDGQGGGAGGGVTTTEDHHVRCARVRGDTVVPMPLGDPHCAPADAVRRGPDGALVALPHFSSGQSVWEQGCTPGNPACVPRIHHFRGLVPDATGTLQALAWAPAGRAAPPGSISIGRYDPNFYVESNLSYPDGYHTWPTFLPFLGLRPHGDQRASGLLKGFWWTRWLEDGAIAVLEVGGEQSDTGRIAFSRLEPPPPLPPPPPADAPALPRATSRTGDEHWVYPATEVRSTVHSGAEARPYLLGYEGLLRRVHIERGGVALEPIAQLKPTGDDFFSAAFVVGDEIIALTQRGFVGVDPWFTPTGIDRSILLKWGDVGVWRAPVPARSAATAPARPSAAFGVQATVFDRDVRVCWPPGNGPARPETFTLAGETPAMTLSQGDCVLLVRADLDDVSTLLRPSAWRVEGEVPGAGLVAIGLSPEIWRWRHASVGWEHPNGPEMAVGQTGPVVVSPALVGAPLAAGGWVSRRTVYGPGLISTLDIATEGRPAPDAAGHGLWMYQPAYLGHRAILHGADGVPRAVELEPFIGPRRLPAPHFYDVWPTPVRGGGVLIGDLKVTPEGAVTVLPAPAFLDAVEGRFVPWLARANGEACGPKYDDDGTATGNRETRLVCVSASGAERRSAPEVVSLGPGQLIETERFGWTVSQDEAGAFVLLQVDLERLEVNTVPLPGAPPSPYGVVGMRAAVHVNFDSAGVPYVVVSAERGEHTIYRLEDTGPVPILQTELAAMANASHIDLVVERDLFVIVMLGAKPSLDADAVLFNPPDVLRVPRAGR